MAPQVAREKIPEAAHECEILREQLDYLIDHAAGNAQCGCAECRRYTRVRAALLEIFTKPPRAEIQKMAPRLVKAA